MKKVLLVGVGLIGGSFSLALRDNKTFTFGGYSRKKTTLDKAQSLGIISESFDDMNQGVKWADWIILSIPVDVIRKVLPGILDQVSEKQLVIDFGSTKGSICEEIKSHKNRKQFLAAHPIAGTEHSGPEAAFPGLFRDKCLIVCEEEQTDHELAAEFENVAKTIGFYTVKMGAQEHDRHLAYISHLSHVSSYALSNAVLQKEKNGEVILGLAGSGFASTVRLAKSSPEMWTPIFLENKKMLLESIDSYLNEIQSLKTHLENDDWDGILDFLERGRQIRKIIK